MLHLKIHPVHGVEDVNAGQQATECPMPQPNELSRSLAVLEPESALIAVVEMSQSSWLVAGLVPGIE